MLICSLMLSTVQSINNDAHEVFNNLSRVVANKLTYKSLGS